MCNLCSLSGAFELISFFSLLLTKISFVLLYSYPTALAMVASGKVDAKPLITHHFPLKKTLEAFETAKTGAGGAIKVMIHCNE